MMAHGSQMVSVRLPEVVAEALSKAVAEEAIPPAAFVRATLVKELRRRKLLETVNA